MEEYRIGMILISGDPNHFENIRSGVRITAISPEGALTVRRIHARYFNTEPVESWTLRPDQRATMNWRSLPIGYQMPLL